jgi:hypothetical protein
MKVKSKVRAGRSGCGGVVIGGGGGGRIAPDVNLP